MRNTKEQIEMSKTNQATAPAVEGIEWGVVEGENTEFAVQYPRMQWVHGENRASGFLKTGGLFISSEQYPNFTAEGFEPTTFVTDDGTEIEGSAASSAKLAVIRIKHQWVKDTQYNRNVPLVHAVIAVKGCEDLLCLSLRGATKSLEFQKAFNQHMAQNVSIANRSKPEGAKSLEPFALWFPIRAAASVKVKAKDSDQSSSVTPPELVVPEKIDRDYVATLWVGAENYKQFAGFFKETAAWQKTPIWEQRNGDNDHTPEFSGGDEPATDQQLQHLINLAMAKGYNEKELMEGITSGNRSKYEELTKTEARDIIEKLSKLSDI